jgi:hypothetical protein
VKQDLLRIYLNDHLGGATAGVELARRAERENRDNVVGEYLRAFIPELVEDRTRLQEVMGALLLTRDPVKVVLGWATEKVGRFKFNGRIVGYSDLSRFVELEGLMLGTAGRVSMWRVLVRLQRDEPRLLRFDLQALAERAERHRLELERLRLLAAEAAFGSAALESPPAHEATGRPFQ